MIITRINRVGKSSHFRVYGDDEFLGELEAEILVRFKLKEGLNISQQQLDEIIKTNADYSCFDRALSVLEKGAKTEKMLVDYLKTKGFPHESIINAVAKAKEYGYINDDAYAENYIKTYSHTKGNRKLKQELLAKGINSEIISEKLSLIDEDEQYENCLMLGKKFARNKIKDDKFDQKLYRHLLSKGYSYGLVGKVVREVKNGGD